MPVKQIVIGSPVSWEKVERSRELRRNMTPGEKRLWEELRAKQLGGSHFRRQQVIGGYIVDFYCHEAALIIEVDGKIHETQVEKDQERDLVLASKGFSILRIKDEQVMQNLPDVLELIKTRMKSKL